MEARSAQILAEELDARLGTGCDLRLILFGPPCANVTWNTCLLEFSVQGSITHGSSTGFLDEPRSIRFEPGHPGRSPEGE